VPSKTSTSHVSPAKFVPAHDPPFALECDEPLLPENANAAPQPWRARKIPLPNVHRSAHILSPTVISDPKLTLDFDCHHALLFADSKYRRAALSHIVKKYASDGIDLPSRMDLPCNPMARDRIGTLSDQYARARHGF
jgi:hypothetical protein